MNKKKISFEPIIEDLKEKFITKSDKPIHFTIDLKAKEVYVDEEFFKELMSNLIDNAIKYSKKSIEIKISSHYDDKYTIIKIYDNGMGISEKDQRTIFDKFERASATKRTKFGGATGFGLGLNYVYQVIEAHEGKIYVNSIEGDFTEFTLFKLLLVEDDPTFSYIVKSGLQEIIGGYEVITAMNGKEGLKAWEEYHPDIIISDIDMPVMNGYQMVERIRETDGDTPILFASALTSPKDVKEGYKLGVNNYVKKPFVPDELDAHIHAILKIKAGTKSRNENEHYKLGRFTLDAKHATLYNDETEEKKMLTVREAKILQLFCKNINETVERKAILSRFWDTEDDYFKSRSLDVFITKLRKLLKDEPRIELKNIRGVGYTLLLT